MKMLLPFSSPTWSVEEPMCTKDVVGIVGKNDNGSACCPTGCGQCGGRGCASAGAKEHLDNTDCCVNGVLHNQELCSETGVAPCIIDPGETPFTTSAGLKTRILGSCLVDRSPPSRGRHMPGSLCSFCQSFGKDRRKCDSKERTLASDSSLELVNASAKITDRLSNFSESRNSSLSPRCSCRSLVHKCAPRPLAGTTPSAKCSKTTTVSPSPSATATRATRTPLPRTKAGTPWTGAILTNGSAASPSASVRREPCNPSSPQKSLLHTTSGHPGGLQKYQVVDILATLVAVRSWV